MRDVRSPLGDRLFGAVLASFVAALLLFIGVHLIEAILPALTLISLAVVLVAIAVWWIRSRFNGW